MQLNNLEEATMFKIRASASGKIAGVKGLGKTGEAYCEEWLKEQIYGRKNTFHSKYTDKGIIMEQDGIDFYADHINGGLILKNETYFENEYFTGTPDVILSDKIADIKCSWDCFTFPLFDKDVNKDYYWQAQVYMELTGKRKYDLVYVLLDTPLHLIEKDAFFIAKDTGEDVSDVIERLKKRHTYSGIPKEHRIKIFEIDYNENDVLFLKDRVIECRNYIKTLTNDG